MYEKSYQEEKTEKMSSECLGSFELLIRTLDELEENKRLDSEEKFYVLAEKLYQMKDAFAGQPKSAPLNQKEKAFEKMTLTMISQLKSASSQKVKDKIQLIIDARNFKAQAVGLEDYLLKEFIPAKRFELAKRGENKDSHRRVVEASELVSQLKGFIKRLDQG